MFTVSLLTAALTAGQAEAPLAWKLKKGDTFYVKTANTNKSTIEVLGMTKEQEQEQEQTSFHRYTVLSAGADGLVVEQTIQKSDFKDTLPGLEDVGRKLKGLKLVYTLNAKSEVTKLEGYDKFIEALAGDNDTVAKGLKSILSEETMKVGVTDLFGFLPGKAAKVGDTWQRNSKFGLGPLGSFELKTDLKLAASDAKAGEKIAWTAKATYTAPNGDDDGGLPFKVAKADLKAEKFEGEYLFDAKAGRLKSSISSGKMAGKMTLGVMGQEVEMDLKQDITITMTVSDKSFVDE